MGMRTKFQIAIVKKIFYLGLGRMEKIKDEIGVGLVAGVLDVGRDLLNLPEEHKEGSQKRHQ